MEEQIRSNRQRELFIKKSTRIAASYLNRAKALSEMPDAFMRRKQRKSKETPFGYPFMRRKRRKSKENGWYIMCYGSRRADLCSRSHAGTPLLRQLYGICHRR